jgi:polar amino acid transport system permease protein
MSVLDILITYHLAFLKGLAVTLQLSMIIWSSGLIFGATLGWAGAHWKKSIGLPTRAVSFILSGIPILVVDPFYTAAFTLSILNIFGVADMVRGVLLDFPTQYITAAKVTGLTRDQTIFRIQLPLILRQVMPGLLLLQVSMLHTTLFASLISVEEIFRVAQRINAQIYRPVEIYTALGVFFVAVCLPVNGFAFWLKQKYTRNLSEH